MIAAAEIPAAKFAHPHPAAIAAVFGIEAVELEDAVGDRIELGIGIGRDPVVENQDGAAAAGEELLERQDLPPVAQTVWHAFWRAFNPPVRPARGKPRELEQEFMRLTGTTPTVRMLSGGSFTVSGGAVTGVNATTILVDSGATATLGGTGSGIRILTVAGTATQPPAHLTDVAYDGKGLLYCSDQKANRIYRVELATQKVSILITDPHLAGPTGLAVHPKSGQLIAVSWDKGKIFAITPDGAVSEIFSNGFFSSRFANLRGVDFDRWGNMYVSDFTTGKVWRMTWACWENRDRTTFLRGSSPASLLCI